MLISVTDAKAQLTDLVRRAEAGEEGVLPRHGREGVKLAAIAPLRGPQARRQLLDAVRTSGAKTATPGPDAARSQDLLYDETGLPI
jgi:prevent-host-death family protein